MKLNYRPEIDGLRAIAVSAVVLYHSELNIFGYDFFTGGFIGVDIFFVISGYLISSIILIEITTKKSFSFKNFYERRIRRIIPVLLTVILVSTIFGWFILSPLELVNFSKSAISSIFFGSNFYFHFSGLEYGALDGLYIPLLHTWSLSVEEQFYIIFPVFILIISKYFERGFLSLLILFFIISFFYTEFGARNYPSSNFYFIFSRVWELLAGTFVAFLEIRFGKREINKVLNNFTPSLGIILIFYSLFFFDDKMLHPSLITIFPVFGTCLIIWFANKDEIFTKILSSKPFVWIGLISYSLYLWHYPAFAFARIIEIFQGEVSTKIYLGIFILLLSFLSYFFIEKPFRDKKVNFNKILKIIFIKLVILLVVLLLIYNKEGFKSRVNSVTLNEYDIEFELKSLDKKKYEKKIQLVFLGDSTIATMADKIKTNYINDFEIINLTSNGCLFIKDFYLERLEYKNLYKTDKNCNEKSNAERLKIIQNMDDFYVIYGGMMPVALTGKYFNNTELNNENSDKILDAKLDAKRRFVSNYSIDIEKNIIDTINHLSELSNQVFLIYPLPELGFNPSYVRGIKKIEQTKNLTISKKLYLERINSTEKIYQKINKKKIKIIHPKDIFCKYDDRCITTNKNRILYSDDTHLSENGATLIINKIIEDLNLLN